MVAGETYATLNNKQKAVAVKKVYDFANQCAKELVTNGAVVPDKWVGEVRTLVEDHGVPLDKYFAAYGLTSQIKSIKDENGDTVDNTKGLRIMNAIYSIPGLSEAQTKQLGATLDVGKTVLGYSESKVYTELANLEKKYAKYN